MFSWCCNIITGTCGAGALAYASTCMVDVSGNGRPVAGYINICPLVRLQTTIHSIVCITYTLLDMSTAACAHTVCIHCIELYTCLYMTHGINVLLYIHRPSQDFVTKRILFMDYLCTK